jgi:hypothetical protein
MPAVLFTFCLVVVALLIWSYALSWMKSGQSLSHNRRTELIADSGVVMSAAL